MENLILKSELALEKLKTIEHKRYLFDEIKDIEFPLIGIRGARGTGKTTLLLQLLSNLNLPKNQAIYISLDDPYFIKNSFTDFIDKFFKSGGKFVFVDEVHKYPGWARELKHVFDFYGTKLKIYYSTSSVLELFKAETDLARRTLIFDLNELSFREFLLLKYNLTFSKIEFEEILKSHTEIAAEFIKKEFRPLQFLKQFYNYGAYPFFLENEKFYHQRLLRQTELILETDIPSVEKIEYSSIYKLKKLLKVIADSAPFKPNIAKISNEVGTSRDMLLKYLELLERARLIYNIKTETKGISYMRKPDKILFNNPNLLYTFADTPSIGTVRETFFVNQLSAKFPVYYATKGDFTINGHTFEIGGKNKTRKQIAEQKDAFVVADDIEIGFNNKIPIWLFGFLY